MWKKIVLIVILAAISIPLCILNATEINTRQLRVREEVLRSDKIDADLDGLLIAYFSDLYYGGLNDDLLEKVLSELRRFRPDIIIFGGDLLSEDAALNESEMNGLLAAFASLKPVYGKYAVSGDQDNQRYLEAAGFTYLDDSNRHIRIDRDSALSLAGIGIHGEHEQAFQGIGDGYYTIVVSHYPDYVELLGDSAYDYMVAGHSLGGQIYLPVISLFNRPEGARQQIRGKTIRFGKVLDITNGIGRKGKDARFLADAEIVLYRLSSR